MKNREFKKMMEKGDKSRWEICYQIAEHYYRREDYGQALSWYQQAIALPDCNPLVYFTIGYLYQHGEGVELDFVEAVEWYEKAAAEDVPQALYNLAYFYQNGLIVNKNPEKALQMLKRATSAMNHLQIESHFYESWKEQAENELEQLKQQCDELKKEVERNSRDLEVETNARIKAEKLTAEYYSQLKSNSKAAEDLLKKIIEEHNSSYENLQKAFELQFSEMYTNCVDTINKLQNINESLHVQYTVLNQTTKTKSKEIVLMGEKNEKLMQQIEYEKKKRKILTVVLFVIVVLFIAMYLIYKI